MRRRSKMKKLFCLVLLVLVVSLLSPSYGKSPYPKEAQGNRQPEFPAKQIFIKNTSADTIKFRLSCPGMDKRGRGVTPGSRSWVDFSIPPEITKAYHVTEPTWIFIQTTREKKIRFKLNLTGSNTFALYWNTKKDRYDIIQVVL
jgi:hypothetical protein